MMRRGGIPIFILWVLVTLAIVSMVFSCRTSNDAGQARHESYNIKAAYLAKAGIMKMLAELARDANRYDSLNEDWNRNEVNPKKLILSSDTVFYGASDESARLNLNGGDFKKDYLIRLGIDEAVAEKILVYKNTKEDKGFEYMEELYLVDGVTPELFLMIEDFFTIYRDSGPRVNINTAGKSVLYAVTGQELLVEKIVNYRKGPDGKEGTEDDGIFKEDNDVAAVEGLDPDLFTIDSYVFRVWAKSFIHPRTQNRGLKTGDKQWPLSVPSRESRPLGRAGSISKDKDIVKYIEAVVDRKTGKFYYWKED